MSRQDHGHHHSRHNHDPHRRATAPSFPPISTESRSWTDNNGVHYTMQTTGFSRPGISFGTMSGSASGFGGGFIDPAIHSHPPPFSVGTGLLGGAFGLLDGLMSSGPPATRQPTRQMYVEEFSSDEDGEDEEDRRFEGHTTGRPRSMFSKFKDKLLENKQRNRQASCSSDPSPDQRSQTSTRQGSYHTETREPASTQRQSQPYGHSDSRTYTEDGHRLQRPRSSRTSSTKVGIAKALENAVEYHAKEIRKCKKQLEQASQHSRVSSDHLQRLLDSLKFQEAAYDAALHDLQVARAELDVSTRPDHRNTPPMQSRPSQPRRASARVVQGDFHDAFFGYPLGFVPRQPAAVHPLFAEAEGLDPLPGSIFGTFGRVYHNFGLASPLHDNFDHFFTVPEAAAANGEQKRPRPSTHNSSPRFEQVPMFSTAPPIRPPLTLLSPDEAKRLYQSYNERWSALSPADPNVPFPTRSLHNQALVNHDTLWAPLVSTLPSTWSEETIMQANAQAFFLGVVDLCPQYTESASTGRLQMGFDRNRASPAQVQQLVDLLKKEKVRWHSDRLGRRNRGKPGVNEALQQNEQARAVFHAVCELVEVAQGIVSTR